jgi:hypothetical protein
MINAELSGRLDRQADSFAKIDGKATTVTGYVLAAASFLATQHPQPVLGGIAYVAYGAAAVLSITAGAVGRHLDVPAPRVLFDRYSDRPKSEALAALSATRVLAYEMNTRRHARQARLWLASVVVLTCGVGFMIAALLVHNS